MPRRIRPSTPVEGASEVATDTDAEERRAAASTGVPACFSVCELVGESIVCTLRPLRTLAWVTVSEV